MNIETAKKVEELLYELKFNERQLKDLQENLEYGGMHIDGKNTIYFSETERKEIANLLENYYKEKIEEINNKILEL